MSTEPEHSLVTETGGVSGEMPNVLVLSRFDTQAGKYDDFLKKHSIEEALSAGGLSRDDLNHLLQIRRNVGAAALARKTVELLKKNYGQKCRAVCAEVGIPAAILDMDEKDTERATANIFKDPDARLIVVELMRAAHAAAIARILELVESLPEDGIVVDLRTCPSFRYRHPELGPNNIPEYVESFRGSENRGDKTRVIGVTQVRGREGERINLVLKKGAAEQFPRSLDDRYVGFLGDIWEVGRQRLLSEGGVLAEIMEKRRCISIILPRYLVDERRADDEVLISPRLSATKMASIAGILAKSFKNAVETLEERRRSSF